MNRILVNDEEGIFSKRPLIQAVVKQNENS